MYEYNPGSVEAVKKGCTCPVMDNCNGKGFIVNGEQQFWINHECPLHGTVTSNVRDQFQERYKDYDAKRLSQICSCIHWDCPMIDNNECPFGNIEYEGCEDITEQDWSIILGDK